MRSTDTYCSVTPSRRPGNRQTSAGRQCRPSSQNQNASSRVRTAEAAKCRRLPGMVGIRPSQRVHDRNKTNATSSAQFGHRAANLEGNWPRIRCTSPQSPSGEFSRSKNHARKNCEDLGYQGARTARAIGGAIARGAVRDGIAAHAASVLASSRETGTLDRLGRERAPPAINSSALRRLGASSA